MSLRQSTAYTKTFLMDDGAGGTGLTVTVNLSKAGAAFGAAAGAVAEIGSGWYSVALTTGDTDTLGDLAFNCTAAGANDTNFALDVISPALVDLQTQITALAADVATVTADVAAVQSDVTAIKAVTDNLPESIKKNTPYAKFPFTLVSSSDHITPTTGATVTAQRSIDGAAFALCTNAVVEVGSGWYEIDLSAADLNGTFIALSFTAPNADARNIAVKTSL